MMIEAISIATPTADRDDRDYDGFRDQVRARLAAALAESGGQLFTTDAAGLWDAYLDALPDRQYHDCHACRKFIEDFGGLVTIDPFGVTNSAIWGDGGDVPEYYRDAVAAMAKAVRRAKVTGVFYSEESTWGRPETPSPRSPVGTWTHFAVTPPESAVYRARIKTAWQAMAEKREDYATLRRGLAEFTLESLNEVVRLLESEALYRDEKVIGPAKWLRDLKAAESSARGPARDNLVWRAVATAPAGFAHPRSTMIGTLLEDIAAGLPFADVSRRFAAKMHPLQYQRPQAAPSAGNIRQAEEIVVKLGIARSLLRRFARLDEIEAIWTPKPSEPAKATDGVFGHLIPKGEAKAAPMALPAITMTWEKFARTVLASAESIEVHVGTGRENFAALTTAVDPDAPPILQWDRDDRRNPVAWYVWHGGSPASQWGLVGGRFHKVAAITLNPARWHGGPALNHPEAVLLIIDGARESWITGAAIFPECLKSDLHPIRATIEAFSRSGTIEGMAEGTANGLMLGKGGRWGARVKVTKGGVSQEYLLDRWD